MFCQGEVLSVTGQHDPPVAGRRLIQPLQQLVHALHGFLFLEQLPAVLHGGRPSTALPLHLAVSLQQASDEGSLVDEEAVGAELQLERGGRVNGEAPARGRADLPLLGTQRPEVGPPPRERLIRGCAGGGWTNGMKRNDP